MRRHTLTLALPLMSFALAPGQIAPGANLGTANVQPAGDVDDDGFADLVFVLSGSWEVRSGRTRLPLPALTRQRVNIQDVFGGLGADLNADGCDDLFHTDRGAGRAEFVSGRDGALLFAFQSPWLLGVVGAADFDGDGADDVMVRYGDALPDIAHVDLLSGRGGSQLRTFQLGNRSCCHNQMFFVGDVDGDGFVDVATTTYSFAQTFYTILAGPDLSRQIHGGSGRAEPGFDTNGDGRDELLTDAGFVDLVTSITVWPGLFWRALPVDLDGDGAMDLFDAGRAWSGRMQSPFGGPTLPGSPWGIGDIDRDGRDEAVENGIVYELIGAPPASIVRDRGQSGSSATGSRPRIRSRLRPRPGSAMPVDLQGGIGGSPAFLALGTATDLDLTPVGAPGNRAYVAPIASLGHAVDVRGFTRQVVAVPASAVLLGVSVSLQWAAISPSANALGVVTSNALDLTIGS